MGMMDKKPYGFLTVPGIVTSMLSILVVFGIGMMRGGTLFNPGALNAQAGAPLGGATSHADLAANCSACHAAFWQTTTMADQCVLCHTDVAAQEGNPTTLHGDQLVNKPGMTCRDCHPDHRGATAALTDLSMIDVSHDAFGYALTAHQKQADGSAFICKTCHANGYIRFDQAVCTTCHQQIKADFMQSHLQAYSDNCLACHDGIDSYGHAFSHAAVTFKLTGKHVPLDCGSCHTGARSIADLKATPQNCASCHTKDDAHKGQFGNGCGTCHTTQGWLPATFDHVLTKFPLTGAHAGLACTKCHTNAVFTVLPTTCVSCHPDPTYHAGLFAGMTCDQCHTTTAWIPAKFNLPHPAGNCGDQSCIDHQGATCNDCHPVSLPTFTCLKCHDSNTPGDRGGGGG
jgi:hypothetical protein